MKKLFKILVAALLLGIYQPVKAQIPDNKGQWFLFVDPNYEVTKNDLIEIAKAMPNKQVTGLYKLSNGQQFYAYHPQEWVKLENDILTEGKGSAITSIADEFADGEIVEWDDNISGTTKNYAITSSGKPWVVDAAYNGGTYKGKNVKVLVVRGRPVLKVYHACINPQRSNIIPKAPAVVVNDTIRKKVIIEEEVVKKPAPKVEEKEEEEVEEKEVVLGIPRVQEFQQRSTWDRPVEPQPQPQVEKQRRGLKITLIGVLNPGGNHGGYNYPPPPQNGGPVYVPPHGTGGPVYVPPHQ